MNRATMVFGIVLYVNKSINKSTITKLKLFDRIVPIIKINESFFLSKIVHGFSIDTDVLAFQIQARTPIIVMKINLPTVIGITD